MTIDRSKLREINLNTIVSVTTLLLMVVGGGILWQNQVRDTQELLDWRAGHEQLHKERLAENRAYEARTDERFRGIDAETRKIDGLTYRITVVEQSTATTSTAIKDLQQQLSSVQGDIRVIREILQRQEASTQRPGR